ncbi:MAG: sulfotransferase [Rhodothermales bacterium]
MTTITRNRPNFFIVGAPKCGTTSLYEYLRQHGEVYMAHDSRQYWRSKEPYFFCRELIARDGLGVNSEEDYLALFADAQGATRIGESSALYLYSEQAAERIKAFAPDARLIIMVRQPVRMMLSWHRDCVRWGHENILDFRDAVQAEPERLAGHRLPPASGYPACLQYTRIATFTPQIERFIDAFGEDAVKICLLEDLSLDPSGTFQDIARFLGIDPSFEPAYEVHNEQVVLSEAQIMRHRMMNWARQHAAWARPIQRVLPFRVDRVLSGVLGRVARNPVALPVDTPFLSQLQRQFIPEIDRLGALIGRDLGHWKTMF